MAYIDYTYYSNEYKGFKVPDGNEFTFYSERATDEINAYIPEPLEGDEITDDVKKCVSALTDLLYTLGSDGPELKSERSGKYSRTLNVSAARSKDRQVYDIMAKYLSGTDILNRGVCVVY